jgi:hypothetical protein
MSEKIDAELAQLRWYLELLYPEAMPKFAQQALEEGYDGRNLRRVAGMIRPTGVDLDPLIDGMFRELGREPMPSKTEAGMRMAEIVCKEIVTGTTSPHKGACSVAFVWSALGYAEELRPLLEPFVVPADDWWDSPERRNQYDDEVVVAAKKLLNRHSNLSG